MSEDKNNEEQRAATQTVAKALDDAIGDDDPVEHETAVLREIKMEGNSASALSLQRPRKPANTQQSVILVRTT